MRILADGCGTRRFLFGEEHGFEVCDDGQSDDGMTRLELIRQRVERASEYLSGVVGEDSIAVMVGEDRGAFVVPIGLADYAALAIHANRDIPALLAVVDAAIPLLTPPVNAREFKAFRAALAPLLESVDAEKPE